MPETPDFEQIARDVIALAQAAAPQGTALVREILYDVWNARGAADIVTIAPSLEYLLILAKAKDPPDVLAHIRALDR